MRIQCIIVVRCKVIGNTVLPHIHLDRVKSTPRLAMYILSAANSQLSANFHLSGYQTTGDAQ